MINYDKRSIILVSNTPQTRQRIERLVGLLDNFSLIKIVDTAKEASNLLKTSVPDIFLVDIDLPDMPGIKFIEQLRLNRIPAIMIILAPEKQGDLILRALRSGASDYLTYDASLEELTISLQKSGPRVIETKNDAIQEIEETFKISLNPQEENKRGHIVTIYSPKGGVGVTSLAVNLAIALQDGENVVALVDSDVQFGDVSVFLNSSAQFSIIDLLYHVNDLDKKVVEDVMTFHKNSGLYLLAAPPRPEYAEQINGNNFSFLLDYLRNIFTYTIINTSSYLSDPTLAALDSGDVVVLLTSQDITAIWATRVFMDLWASLGMSNDRISLVLNRYKKNKLLTPQKIGERLKHPIVTTIDEEEEFVFRSNNLGLPFILNDREAPISQNVISIAEHIRKTLPQLDAQPRFRLFEVEPAPKQAL